MIYGGVVVPDIRSRRPHWYGIPLRVLLITFLGTLVCFAISLFLAIIGTVIASSLRGAHPDMRIAYRSIALPVGLTAGAVIFVVSVVMEVRHYRQNRALSAIEKLS